MMIILLLKALFFGFLVAAPVGPVGALVIRRTLKRGVWLGFATGTGSAVGDTIYATVVAMGLSTVEHFVVANGKIISLGGGLVLLAMGGFSLRKNFRDRAEDRADAARSTEQQLDADLDEKTRALDRAFEKDAGQGNPFKAALKASVGSFLITISNPMTIVGFAGTFAAFGFWNGDAPETIRDPRYAMVVGGIACGALCWWMSLALLIRWLSSRLSEDWVHKIHISTSLVIVVSGVLCLARGFSL